MGNTYITNLIHQLTQKTSPDGYITYLDLIISTYIREEELRYDADEAILSFFKFITKNFKGLDIINTETGEILYTIKFDDTQKPLPMFGVGLEVHLF